MMASPTSHSILAATKVPPFGYSSMAQHSRTYKACQCVVGQLDMFAISMQTPNTTGHIVSGSCGPVTMVTAHSCSRYLGSNPECKQARGLTARRPRYLLIGVAHRSCSSEKKDVTRGMRYIVDEEPVFRLSSATAKALLELFHRALTYSGTRK